MTLNQIDALLQTHNPQQQPSVHKAGADQHLAFQTHKIKTQNQPLKWGEGSVNHNVWAKLTYFHLFLPEYCIFIKASMLNGSTCCFAHLTSQSSVRPFSRSASTFVCVWYPVYAHYSTRKPLVHQAQNLGWCKGLFHLKGCQFLQSYSYQPKTNKIGAS